MLTLIIERGAYLRVRKGMDGESISSVFDCPVPDNIGEGQIIAVRSEEGLHGQSLFFRVLILAVAEEPWQLPGQAGGEGNESAGVLPQQLLIDAGLDIKALGKASGDHVTQIAVSLLIPAKEDQMAGGCVKFVFLLKPGPGCHVDLTADNGLDPLRLTGLVKVHGSIHDAVVGDGDRILPQLFHPLYQPGDAAAAVQEAELSMDM